LLSKRIHHNVMLDFFKGKPARRIEHRRRDAIRQNKPATGYREDTFWSIEWTSCDPWAG
jgi:hypothetical protein